MAGVMSAFGITSVAGMVVAMLILPVPAQAGWFVRNNQTAYHLSMEGHDSQALNYWDGSAEGWYGKGTALMHLGRMREAEQAFRQSLALAPHKTGFSDDLEMPVKRRPGFMASLWYNLGNVLYAQDRLVEARQAWLSALRYRPDHAKARHNLEIVDRLLRKREQEQQGLTGLSSTKSGKSKHGKAPQSGGASPPQQQATEHGLLPLHRPGSSEQSGSSKSAETGKPSGATEGSRMASSKTGNDMHRSTPHHGHTAGSGSGHGANGAQRMPPSQGTAMSPEQAANELRMVEEGVSVFLKHRLQAKSSQTASRAGGDPW